VDAIRDRYTFDQTLLAQNMITSITSLTNATYFSLCGGSATTDKACVEKIADQSNPMRDIIQHFSLHNPTPATPLNHVSFQSIIRNVYGSDTKVVMSTPIHVHGLSTEFHVTISVPFLKVYDENTATTTRNNLLMAGFPLEDTVQHQFELDMLHTDVTPAVQAEVQKMVADLYALGLGKVKVTVHDAGGVNTGKTKIDVVVRSLRQTAATYAAETRQNQEHKTDMVYKIDAALVTATYKKVVAPKSDTTTGETSSDSNDRLYIWLLLAFLLIGGIAFVIFARQQLKRPPQYTQFREVPVGTVQGQFPLATSTSAANPYWNHYGGWHH